MQMYPPRIDIVELEDNFHADKQRDNESSKQFVTRMLPFILI